MKTYSLAEVAEILGLNTVMKHPEEWLRKMLRRGPNRGGLKGIKVGRTWRMTEDQLRWNMGQLSNDKAAAPITPDGSAETAEPVSILAGLSERGRASVLRNQRTA